MKVLVVLTSHDQLGDTGHKTGFWLEELAAPYYAMQDAGVEMTLASPAGGQPPLDPGSAGEEFQTDDTRRFEKDPIAQERLANTMTLSEVDINEYDGVFYPGGHGPLWDLAEDKTSIAIIEDTIKAHKPVALVCHAPGALRHVKNAQGDSLVKGKKVTGFSNSEEAAVQLTDVVPFLVEDMLQENGGEYSKADDWTSYVLTDGLLITGQNPQSSAETATALIKKLNA